MQRADFALPLKYHLIEDSYRPKVPPILLK